MKQDIPSIINELQETWKGEPWFGRSVYSLLEDVKPSQAYKRPNAGSHSLADLLYHMITWAEFTLRRLKGVKEDMNEFEKLDWREIDPDQHGWRAGVEELDRLFTEITGFLSGKDENFLDQKVDYREYDVRYLLNGLIHHNIYHAGQVAYLYKLLS